MDWLNDRLTSLKNEVLEEGFDFEKYRHAETDIAEIETDNVVGKIPENLMWLYKATVMLKAELLRDFEYYKLRQDMEQQERLRFQGEFLLATDEAKAIHRILLTSIRYQMNLTLSEFPAISFRKGGIIVSRPLIVAIINPERSNQEEDLENDTEQEYVSVH